MSDDRWSRLQNLKYLLDEGFVTRAEYDERRAQLVDELTGTSSSSVASSITNTRTRQRTVRSSVSSETPTAPSLPDAPESNFRPPSSPQKEKEKEEESSILLPAVVPRGPPSFDGIPTEAANKFTFDIHKNQWVKTTTQVKIDPVPFSRGALRFVYHLKETDQTGSYVAKMSFDPRDALDRSVYFKDVEMQCYAREYAKKFNEYKPPKAVDFVAAWNLELIQRPGRPICGVERYIDGQYAKHNNNYGYVSEEDRNTPQAFSHFSYEASGHTLLICDIQGVGDMYTDPQIHSVDGQGFGKGNLGKKGFDKFLLSHRCNVICSFLKLPAINMKFDAVGTMPATRFMPNEHVDVVDFSNRTPLLAQPAVPYLLDSSTPILNIEKSEGTCCHCTLL